MGLGQVRVGLPGSQSGHQLEAASATGIRGTPGQSRTEGKSAFHFTHIRLENWRNFVEIDLPLQGRVFLVGPNASGKSNFLDVFRFLRDIVSVGGGFQAAVQLRGGVSSLRSLAARRYSDVSVTVQVGSHSNPAQWEYELRFSQDTRRRPIIKMERVAKSEKSLWTRPNQDDQNDPERLTQTYLEQVTANREFRELVEFFASIRYLHLVPQLVKDPGRVIGKKSHPFGSDFLEQVARTPTNTRKARLRRIREALRVAVPQMEELEQFRDVRGVPHLRGKYQTWRSKGAWQTEEEFSDGTLRLMGLLWALQDGSGPLLLEEPELSLHPEVVRYIPALFSRVQMRKGRQVLASTHSPELLSGDGIGLDEVLLLIPKKEGTIIKTADQIGQVRELLAGGSSLAELVIPETRPRDARQLSVFDFE